MMAQHADKTSGQGIRDSYIRLVDNGNGTEIAKYELGEDLLHRNRR